MITTNKYDMKKKKLKCNKCNTITNINSRLNFYT